MLDTFVSTTMAPRWDQGVVAGTGSVGAVLHGTPARHVIDLTHEEFFLPVMDPRPAPHLAPVLPEVRALLLDHAAADAARLVDERAQVSGMTDLIWTDPFAPAASVAVVPHLDGQPTDYRRAGRFDTGEVSVSWRAGDAAIELTVLPLRGRDTIALRITSTAALTCTLSLYATEERGAPIDAFAGVDSSAHVSAQAGVDGGGALTLSVRPAGRADSRVAHTRMHIHPPTTPPSGTAAEVNVGVMPGAAVYAILTVTVDDDEPAFAGPLDDTVWDTMVREQRATHGNLTGRSRLELGGARTAEDVESLFAAARAGDPAALLGLVEHTYTAGRHLIISATGTLPPNLQGLWQGSWTAPWSSDYTMNGNLQTAVAALASTGTPELLTSVFRLLGRFGEHFRNNAHAIYGADGHLLPARMSTHGHANHFLHNYPHQYWIGNGGWMLRLAYEYFTVTGDRAFVEHTGWPLAVQVLRFYTSALVADAAGGRHAVPCFSPENTPAGATTPLSADATSEIAMIRDAVRIGCRFAELLGQHTLAQEWTAFGRTLPPYQVAADGSLAEWLDPRFREQPGHRHASHLYPLWYEPDPAFGPAERAAAAVTIAQKLAWRRAQPGPQQMAFGIVQLGLAAAHLGDADTALECVAWLARDHWAPNLVPTHDEGAIFNVDAAGGLPHLVAEMLLQSTSGELRVLPALPTAWPTGRITGLRARGGVAVDELTWTARAATMTCRLVPDSQPARADARVTVVPPPHFAGPRPSLTVELSSDAVTLTFPEE
jgi:alpha-L-fucosidase 2